MKTKFLFLILIISITNKSYSQDLPEAYSLNEMNVKDKVSSIIETHFQIENGKPKEEIFKTVIYDFDSKGILIKEKNTKFLHNSFFYDNMGRLIEQKQNSSLIKYTYTQKENLTVRRSSEHTGEGSFETYQFDKDKKLIEKQIFYTGNLNKGFTYTYNKRKQIVSTKLLNFFIEYFYDSEGNVVKEVTTKLETNEHYKTTEYKYIYNKEKNWISREQTIQMYEYEKSACCLIKREYKYY